MSAEFNPATFQVVFKLVLLLAHLYLYWRLTHHLREYRYLKWALLVPLPPLYMLYILQPLTVHMARSFTTPLAWVMFCWLGLLMFSCLVFAALQVLELPVRLSVPSPERRALFRRLAGYGGVGASAALGGIALGQALRPVAVKEVAVTLKKLPSALDGLRVVQLSDLHVGPILARDWLSGVVDRVNALQPDLILITGDLSDGSWASLKEQVVPLGGLKAASGVWFVTGNHDYLAGYKQWIKHLPELGVQPLCNERVTLYPRGGTAALDLAGVNDYAGIRAHHAPDFSKALDGRDVSRPVLLMAHQPRAVLEAASHGVDLQLSGHTHGGQIWPMRYLVGFLQPYAEGLHSHPGGDTQIYVSEGTGFWGPPMRLGTAAEITHITLRAGTTA